LIVIKVHEVVFDAEKMMKKLSEEAEKILSGAAEAAHDEAFRKIPVRTGLLLSSLELVRVGELEYMVSAGGGRYGERNKPYYAPFVEWGTRRMAPRPYMRPAWQVARRFIGSRLKNLSLP